MKKKNSKNLEYFKKEKSYCKAQILEIPGERRN